MKNILIALMMVFALNLNGQNVVKNLTIYNLDPFVLQCLKELDVDSCTVILQPVKGLIFNKYLAVTTRNEGTFTVGLSKSMDYQKTLTVLAEEIAHIWQMKSGRLIISDHVIFDGKKNNPVDDVWVSKYEVEARKIALQLLSNNKLIVLL